MFARIFRTGFNIFIGRAWNADGTNELQLPPNYLLTMIAFGANKIKHMGIISDTSNFFN